MRDRKIPISLVVEISQSPMTPSQPIKIVKTPTVRVIEFFRTEVRR